MEIFLAIVLGGLLGAAVAGLTLRMTYATRLASAATESSMLRQRVTDLTVSAADDLETAALVQPLAAALERVERQVQTLEKERTSQFSAVSLRLEDVVSSTSDLRSQTASLVGSLNASSVRGSWGEVQLRRVLEHAGLLSRCDFDEQVTGTNADGATVRPDVVVHLPGGKNLVVDSKAPMTAFLAAQADGLSAPDREAQLKAHARALRGHLDALAGKGYWSALPATAEMVVCFVPGEAILSAALARDPELHEYAMRKRVVLASPATLLALLRTVAFTWQQDALTANARELLGMARELYDRLAGLGGHASKMGAALQRSVEAYNALIGSLETRVFVTARRMKDLDLVEDRLVEPAPLTTGPRPLSALELLEALEPEVARPELVVDGRSSGPGQASGAQRGA